jgi:pyruvate kinase
MNTIKVHLMGNVLNRGQSGFGSRVTGRIVSCPDAATAQRRLRLDTNEVLLTSVFTEELLPLVPQLLGVVLQNDSNVHYDRLREANPNLVLIALVPDAVATIEDGITVTLDGEERIIYEGVF